MPKISVIIPVYNAKDYLSRCLDSVINQTLKDIEIICVNDCSKDNSIDILNDYAKKDNRIKVIDCEKNGGESVARNIGLSNVTGEYLAFVDNDDVIDLDFYEKLYKKASETNADIVKANVETVDIENTQATSELNTKLHTTKNKWFFHYEWWSAIYKTSLIKKNNIFLPEGYPLGGDCLFLHYALEKCNKLEVIDDTFYHWLRRENSGESKILPLEKVISALKIFDDIFDNTNKMYNNNIIDKNSYLQLCKICMWVPLNYIYRNDIIESKKICMDYILKFYNKCYFKDEFENYISENNIIIINALKDNNIKALEQIFLNCTKMQYLNKNIFAKLRIGLK